MQVGKNLQLKHSPSKNSDRFLWQGLLLVYFGWISLQMGKQEFKLSRSLDSIGQDRIARLLLNAMICAIN